MSSENSGSIISFTQFSMWLECPHRWELSYAKNLRSRESSIHGVYGTAVHRAMQDNITNIYSIGEPLSDLGDRLFEYLHEEFTKELNKRGEIFSSPDELYELYIDGIGIMNYIQNKWREYYRPQYESLIGIEIPIDMYPDPTRPNLRFVAYIDVGRRRGNKIILDDIKTSKDGWNRFQINKMSKISQLVLYRHFYSIQYGISPSEIDAEFFIVKRKPSTPSRVQLLDIEYDKLYSNIVMDKFEKFINDGFDSIGMLNKDVSLPSISGKSGENCRFCEFKDDHTLCNPLNRIS